MANKLFLDTDVILDYLTDRQPFANYSSLLFEMHEQKKVQIFISALSINNIYYVARKIIGEKKTLSLIDALIEDIEVVGTSKVEIRNALDSDFKDFEDAIQHSTAFKIKDIEAIITRNSKDYRKSKIAVFTPEIYLTTHLES